MATPLSLKYQPIHHKRNSSNVSKNTCPSCPKGPGLWNSPGIHSDPMPALKTEVGRGLTDATHIPTPDGWTTVGEIAVGQQAFDDRGEPCTVIGVYPQGDQPVCRVIFDDWSILTAGFRQPWVTLTHSHRAKIHKETRYLEEWSSCLMPPTTEDIGAHLLHESGKLVEAMHSVPLAQPLQLPDRSLPIDPYLLGLWLGDGTSVAADITCHTDDEPHYRKRALAAGENWRIRNSEGLNGDILTCTLSGEPQPRFLTRLRELGVKGNKHIPTLYLRSGNEQRLALLHGLMDSDGHIDDRGLAEYTSISHSWRSESWSLRSLSARRRFWEGGMATLYGRPISDKWRVLFTPTIYAASLPRKADRLTGFLERREGIPLTRLMQRYIRAAYYAGTRRTTGIAVDSPSRLFLAGRSMIPALSGGPPSN